MKSKFVGSALTVLLSASCALAWAASKDAMTSGAGGYRATDSQLQMLDGRLAQQVKDFMELADVVARQMQQSGVRERHDELLLLLGNQAGPQVAVQDLPVTTPVVKAQTAPAPSVTQPTVTEQTVPEPGVSQPWQSQYWLELIMTSESIGVAVINGTYVRVGDVLNENVMVISIANNEVVLERRGERLSLLVQ